MPNINISRIESDIRRLGKKAKNIVANDTTPSIFISTKSEIQEFLPKISLIIYPLLESDFGLGMYDTGEKIYQEIAWSLEKMNLCKIYSRKIMKVTLPRRSTSANSTISHLMHGMHV